AHLRVRADAAPDDALQPTEDPLGDGGRPDRNPTDDAPVLADAPALHVEGGGNENRRLDGHRSAPGKRVVSPACLRARSASIITRSVTTHAVVPPAPPPRPRQPRPLPRPRASLPR